MHVEPARRRREGVGDAGAGHDAGEGRVQGRPGPVGREVDVHVPEQRCGRQVRRCAGARACVRACLGRGKGVRCHNFHRVRSEMQRYTLIHRNSMIHHYNNLTSSIFPWHAEYPHTCCPTSTLFAFNTVRGNDFRARAIAERRSRYKNCDGGKLRGKTSAAPWSGARSSGDGGRRRASQQLASHHSGQRFAGRRFRRGDCRPTVAEPRL